MSNSTLRSRINSLLGLILLSGLAYLFWPFVFGRGQMQEFCPTLQQGLSLAQVKTLAAVRGYKVTDPIEGQAFVHSPRSMGRFNCVLSFGKDGLQSSRYADND